MSCDPGGGARKNDHGETIVKRGVTGLRMSAGRKALLRFLALAGACQLIFFAAAGAPHMLVGAHSGDWPADLQSRSYFLDGLCGQGTGRDCPGREGKPPVPLKDGHGGLFHGRLLGGADE
jgi:hypothetical protein